MRFWNKPHKKVLVVGGEGFIGSRLMRTDIFDLTSLDTKSDQDFRAQLFVEEYDVVVLLAASMAPTPTGYDYNKSLYEALDTYMAFYPKTQVIFTSSAAVYPDSKLPSSERTCPEPFNWYGKSKLLGEAYVHQFQHYAILRLSNVYGSGDGHGVIDRFMRRSRIIYGIGQSVRDFVPVETVVQAIIAAIDNPKAWQGITNVSTGKGSSVAAIWSKYGRGEIIFRDQRKTDVKCSILDNSKLLTLLGDV